MRSSPSITAFDFTEEIDQLTRGFVGREWVFRRIDVWLAGDERVFLLVGSPGIGKSAIAAQLIRGRSDVVAHHFCVAGRRSTSNPSAAIRSLAAQLSQRMPGYDLALANTVQPTQLHVDVRIDRLDGGSATGVVINNLYVKQVRDEFEVLLRAPLAALPSPDRPLILLVDSLDEADTYTTGRGGPSLGQLLAESADLPPWLRLILTSRPQRSVLRHFPDDRALLLDDKRAECLVDTRLYLDTRLAEAELRRWVGDDESADQHQIVTRLHELGSGNFLYLKTVVNALAAGDLHRADLGMLPPGLDGIYQAFLLRLSGSWEDRYLPLLEILAVAQEPLTEVELAHLSKLAQGQVRRYLSVLGQLTIASKSGTETTHRLFHDSLRDYLLDGDRNEDFWCDPAIGHRKVSRRYLDEFNGHWTLCDRYGLSYLPVHLRGAGEEEQLSRLLFQFDWLTAKIAATGPAAARADLELLSAQPAAVTLMDTLFLSAHALADDATGLAGQLLGRLMGAADPSVESLLRQAAESVGSWLRPLARSLTPPGGALLRTLVGHTDEVTAVTITPDGRQIVSASRDHTIRVWDLHNGSERMVLRGSADAVHAVLVTPDGQHVLSGGGDRWPWIIQWRLNNGQAVTALEGHRGAVHALAFQCGGAEVVSSSADGTIATWDLTTGESTDVKGPLDPGLTSLGGYHAVAVSSDGRFLVAALGWNMYVWDRLAAAEPCVHHSISSIGALALTRDDRSVLMADGSWIKQLDLRSNEQIRKFSGHYSHVQALVTLHDGRHFLSGDGSHGGPGPDCTVRMWDLATGAERFALIGHTDAVSAIAVTGDDHIAVTASADGTLKIWDLEVAARQPHRGHTMPITAVTFSADGGMVATGSQDTTVRLWNPADGAETMVLRGHTAEVQDLRFSPDAGRFVSVGADRTLRRWDTRTGAETASLPIGDTNFGRAVAMTPDGRLAAYIQPSFLDDRGPRKLTVWDLDRWAERWVLPDAPGSVGWIDLTPDGSRCVAVSSSLYECVSVVWRLDTGEVSCRMKHLAEVNAMAVHPNGNRAVFAVNMPTGQRGELVRRSRMVPYLELWDLSTGALLHRFHSPQRLVTTLLFTDEPERVGAGSEDGSVVVWDMARGVEVHRLPGHSGAVSNLLSVPPGDRILSVSADAGTAYVSDSDGRDVVPLRGHGFWGQRTVLALSPSGRQLAWTAGASPISSDTTLKVWDLSTATQTRSIPVDPAEAPADGAGAHTGRVNAVAITADGATAVTAGADRTIQVWNLATGEGTVALVGHTHAVSDVAVTANGERAVSVGSDETLRIWDLDGRTAVHVRPGTPKHDARVVLTHDGAYAVTGGDRDGYATSPNCIRVWELATGLEIDDRRIIVGESVDDLTVTPDDRFIAAADGRGQIHFWEMATGQHCFAVPGQAPFTVTADGNNLVAMAEDHSNHLRVWDITTVTDEGVLGRHDGSCTAMVSLTGPARIVSASSDRTIRVWNLAAPHNTLVLSGHTAEVTSIATNEHRLASVSTDGTVRLWDLADGRPLTAFTADGPLVACALTPDGRIVVAAEKSGRIHRLRLEPAE
ncbi:hypothetical protein [Streptomyces sp. NPDC056468]|uniref:hypothetical protein n=1 Tax=Streptomyces sp. NPDC056468 TaxID=3345830 RepID=UPI003686864F